MRRVTAFLVVEAAALIALAWLPGLRSTPWPALAVWTLSFGAYAGMAAGLGRDWPSRRARRRFWLAGVALRATLLPATPHLSDDIWRYLWDGWVARSGINPYVYAPAEAPETLRTAWWNLINNPEIPTIYPPGAQVWFLILASIVPAWLLFKLAWVAADLALAWTLERFAERTDRPAPLVLALYLFSPLVLVEVAWSGHLEPLGLLAVLGALAFAATPGLEGDDSSDIGRGKRNRVIGGVLLGLGAAVKFAPLAALPAVVRRWGPVSAALVLVTPLLLYLPYADPGARLFEGLSTYADRWAFNPGVFRGLEWLVGPGIAARAAGAAVVGGIAVWAGVRRWSVERALFWTIGAALVVSPTLHPWYVLWILPLAALRRSWPWLLFSGSVFFSYYGRDLFHATGTWPVPLWVAVVVHAPLLSGLLMGGLQSLVRSDAGQSVGG